MGLLEAHGVQYVYHYTPLHYLAFIARIGALLSKPSLIAEGFAPSHFRSMSSKQDLSRGFGEFAHLTLDKHARILKAKLEAGFPHIGIRIPASSFSDGTFLLCRYNVAMTRYLKRGNTPGFLPSAENGRYYGDMQIPVARETADIDAMLSRHLPLGTMIEVLVAERFELSGSTEIVCFSDEDEVLARKALASIPRPWKIGREDAPGDYNRDPSYAESVSAFLDSAISDADWRGNGLEFDRV